MITATLIKFYVDRGSQNFVNHEGLIYAGGMPADPAVLRRKLTALVAHQAGYFTAAQAREIGYSYPAQKYHADRGNWERIRRGIFRIPGWPVREDDAYALWDLWSGGRAILSHETALAVHDLGDANSVHVHMTVPPGFRADNPALVLHRADVSPADVEDREGYRVTTVERSLLDAASGDMPQEQMNSAVSDAVGRRLVKPRLLRSRSDEFGPRAALRIERALSAESSGA